MIVLPHPQPPQQLICRQILGIYFICIFATCEEDKLHPILLLFYNLFPIFQVQHKNLILKKLFTKMLKAKFSEIENQSNSFFSVKNRKIHRQPQTFKNNDSPMRAAFLQASKKSLSPFRRNHDMRKSPIINSNRKSPNKYKNNGIFAQQLNKYQTSRDGSKFSNQNVGISFSSLYKSNSANYVVNNNRTLSINNGVSIYSQNQQQSYIQSSQYNICENQKYKSQRKQTNLFGQLAAMIESNGKKCQQDIRRFCNQQISGDKQQNSFRQRIQTGRSPNPKLDSDKRFSFAISPEQKFFKNVQTIQSIQSPEQFQLNKKPKLFNPFQIIQSQKQQQKPCICSKNNKNSLNHQSNKSFEPLNSFGQHINNQIYQEQDSEFASVRLLLDKIDFNQEKLRISLQHQSVIMSKQKFDQLNMNPF